METKKLTQKQLFIGGKLINHLEKGINAYEFNETYEKDLKSQNIDTTRINASNATLASLAGKGLATKTKVAYKERMVTNYKPTQALIDLLKESK